MPDFTIEYNIEAPQARTYKVIFTTGQYCHMTFESAGQLIDYVTKWETDPPLYHWNIQSVWAVERISKPILNAIHWMEE